MPAPPAHRLIATVTVDEPEGAVVYAGEKVEIVDLPRPGVAAVRAPDDDFAWHVHLAHLAEIRSVPVE